MGTISFDALLVSVRELPAAFQQNPVGAAIVTGLVVYTLACWVTVTWLKHRRR